MQKSPPAVVPTTATTTTATTTMSPPVAQAQPIAAPIWAAPGYCGYRLPSKPQLATDVWCAWH